MRGSRFQVGLSIERDEVGSVNHHVGMALQFIVLTATPLISWWQLQFGFNLIWMPGLLTLAAVLFWIGTRLRESR